MTKHTPGPWKWSKWSDEYPAVMLVGADGGPRSDNLVLEIYSSHGGGEFPSEEDARLIAFAPDLYAALLDLVERADRTPLADGSNLDTAWANAVLDKVEGGRE